MSQKQSGMPRFFSGSERRRMRRAVNRGRRTFAGTRQLCRVTKVYDADTINVVTRLSKREDHFEYSVRLFGIDAPEMRPSMDMPNRDLHKQAAMVVRDRLVELIPVDSVVCIEFEKEEKFGRLMGVVRMLEPGWWGCRWYPAMSVAEQLLKEGLVMAYSGGAKAGFDDAHLRRIVNSAVPGPGPTKCHSYASLYPTIHETAEEPGN